MQQREKVYLYRAILAFAFADVGLGIASFFIDAFPVQIAALSITAITLVLSVIFAIKYPKTKRSDISMIVIGGLDFVTTFISVLVIVMATQLIAILASGFTLIKAIKVFVQSEKARRLIGATKPFLLNLAKKYTPILGAWVVAKKSKIKNKTIGDNNMEKVKEFFTKLGKLIRANKICLLETILNGGIWGVAGWLADSVESIAIEVSGFNVLPLFSIIGFVLIELIFQWESSDTFLARIAPKLEERNKKLKEKEREKLLEEMREEKAAAEKEIEAKKEEEERIKKEAEEKAKKEQEDKELEEWLAKRQAK